MQQPTIKNLQSPSSNIAEENRIHVTSTFVKKGTSQNIRQGQHQGLSVTKGNSKVKKSQIVVADTLGVTKQQSALSQVVTSGLNSSQTPSMQQIATSSNMLTGMTAGQSSTKNINVQKSSSKAQNIVAKERDFVPKGM